MNFDNNFAANSLKVPSEVWLCDLTYTQQTIASDTIPMAVAGIATYTEAHIPTVGNIRIFKYPEDLCAAIGNEGPPNIIGFSNYVWNFHLGYAIADILSREYPETLIIFGGPNYPLNHIEQERFLHSYPAIDIYIAHEGEYAFFNVVKTFMGVEKDKAKLREACLPSTHYAMPEGGFQLNEKEKRITSLSEIPSPYLSGKLDQFFDGKLMPLLQTNRGCPFSCTFCVEGDSYYNKISHSSSDKLVNEFNYIGEKMATIRKDGGRNDLFIADSNFGMYKTDLNTAELIASVKERYGWPEYINVATGKNHKERVLEVSNIIDGSLRLSGSVQSLNPTVLENIKRKNISASDLMDLSLSASQINANSYSEIILGLPGETRDSHYQTVRQVIEAGFNNVWLFQLMLLPGSELNDLESRARYSMQTCYRALPRCYGRYSVLNVELAVAEIEEICVSTNTLSFEEYIECRFMHLIVTIFYNDAVFGLLLKYIKAKNLSVWDWIELLIRTKPKDKLNQLFNEFLSDTREELWDSKEDLQRRVSDPKIVQDYVDGLVGNNLLFTYKTKAITECIEELADFAFQATDQLLSNNRISGTLDKLFVENIIRFHRHSIENIFESNNLIYKDTFSFDLVRFSKDDNTVKLVESYEDSGYSFCFYHDDSQKELIHRYLGIYGNSIIGLGRILSKVFVRKLFRHAVPAEQLHVEPTHGHISDLSAQISGLQH